MHFPDWRWNELFFFHGCIGYLDVFYRYPMSIFLFAYLLWICWDLLYSALCLLTLWPLLYLPFPVFIYTEDFSLQIVKSVLFSFLPSEFRDWLRRSEPFIVYSALSFWFFHMGLGLSEVHIVSSVEIRKGKVGEGHISFHIATWGKTQSRNWESWDLIPKSLLPAA